MPTDCTNLKADALRVRGILLVTDDELPQHIRILIDLRRAVIARLSTILMSYTVTHVCISPPII